MYIGFDRFIETKVPENELIISRTDLRGIITYANETFAQISGYEVDELIGKPHNIVRHPDMPKSVFKGLWQSLKEGEKWEGAVKNLRKDGGYYWVWAEVSAVEKDGKVVEYKSMRSPLATQDKITYQRLYESMKTSEENRVFISSYLSKQCIDGLKKYAKNGKISLEIAIEQVILKGLN
jgi:aerotaxis receptor